MIRNMKQMCLYVNIHYHKTYNITMQFSFKQYCINYITNRYQQKNSLQMCLSYLSSIHKYSKELFSFETVLPQVQLQQTNTIVACADYLLRTLIHQHRLWSITTNGLTQAVCVFTTSDFSKMKYLEFKQDTRPLV